MSPKRLEDLMRNMSESLKEKDIIQDLPSIIDDLEFIVKTYGLKIKGLTEEQRINHIYDIETYKMTFLAELIKKYMKLTLNKSFDYRIGEEVLFQGAVSAYDPKEDKIVISAIGSLLNSFNTADSMKSIIHEYSHQYFFGFLSIDKMEEMLNYPSNYIIIAKNYFSREIPKEGKTKVQGQADYFENYNRVYMEVDACDYALKTVRTFLLDLYNRYPNKNIKLEKKINKLQKTIIEQSMEVEKHYKEAGSADQKYLDELNAVKPITSTVIVDGEEKDNLLYTDKFIKNNPMLRDKYKVLGILMEDYSFKPYNKIILDKYRYIDEFGNATKINEIYSNIINTDPMLLISKLVMEKDTNGIIDFIKKHPTFKDEYENEINELFNNEVASMEIINLLSKEENVVLQK